jgi:hypothetical protein
MRFQRRLTLAAVAAGVTLAAPAAASTSRGPSTPIDPYVLPVADGVHITSLLTVDGALGDGGAASNGYEMVGTPDGLGAMQRPGRDFTLYMNHELGDTQGIVRAHGQAGAFVSRWEIDPKTLKVKKGSDLIAPGVQYWNYVTQRYQGTASPGGDNPRTFGSEQPNVAQDDFVAQRAAIGRLCSGTLTDPGQLYNERTGRGYLGQIFFPNEETGIEGRAFGTLEDGTTKQLPRLGLFSYENAAPAANRSDTTLVMGNEDSSDGQLRVYVGDKRRRGDAFDRAGLTDGVNHVVDLVDETVSGDAAFRARYGEGTPVEFDLSEVDWDQSGAAQNAEATADGLSLSRIEDGAWDPRNPSDYYFVATDGGDVRPGLEGGARDSGGLWRLSFEDIERPERGGTLTLLLDGVGGDEDAVLLNSPDNLDIDRRGNLLIQEDPGNSRERARIVAYQIHTGELGVLAQFDAALFSAPTPVLTINEETSGIVDAREVLGRGWWLFDAQVHRPVAGPAVAEGQLLAMRIKRWDEVYRSHMGPARIAVMRRR